MTEIIDYNKILSDKKLFFQTVYTPLSEAIKILDERRQNKVLKEKIEKLLENNIPEPLRNEGRFGIQSRHIATPNRDTHWFLELTKDTDLIPIFLEYHEDKLTSNNDSKYSLGMLRIRERINKRGDFIEEKINIVNFSKDDGKKIKDIHTLKDEPLVGFHHNLFETCGYSEDKMCFYDNSRWFESNGGKATSYYVNFLLLFVYHGIFFENYPVDGEDGDFTRNIFLPSFIKAIELSGEKPLIVPIPPMDNELDSHWFSYKEAVKKYTKL